MFVIEWWEQTLMAGHGQRAGQMERWPSLPYPGLEVQLLHVGYAEEWRVYRVVKVQVAKRTGDGDMNVMVQVEAVEAFPADDFPRVQLRDEELLF